LRSAWGQGLGKGVMKKCEPKLYFITWNWLRKAWKKAWKTCKIDNGFVKFEVSSQNFILIGNGRMRGCGVGKEKCLF